VGTRLVDVADRGNLGAALLGEDGEVVLRDGTRPHEADPHL
jgi:hypothetical protein